MPVMGPIDPVGPFDEADYTPGYRARITQLEAENERLRAVLRQIADNEPLDLPAQEPAERALDDLA